jgi:hypothetical protein
LIPADAIERRETDRIKELAHRFLGFVKDARQRLAPAVKEAQVSGKSDFSKLDKRPRTA